MANRPASAEDSQVTTPDSPDHENPAGNPSLGRVERFLERHRRTAVGRLYVRIVITALGLAVIGVGIILLPLPGPGWVIIFGGMAIWSLEYEWAARLRRFTIRQVTAWTKWLGRQSWWMRTAVALGLLVVVAVAIAGSLLVSLGPDFFQNMWSML